MNSKYQEFASSQDIIKSDSKVNTIIATVQEIIIAIVTSKYQGFVSSQDIIKSDSKVVIIIATVNTYQKK